MENKRVTADGREREGKQSKMFFSKAPFISGAYILKISYITEVKTEPTIYQFNFVILIGVSGMATENGICSFSPSSAGGSPETSSNTPGEMYFGYINTTVSSL